MFCAAYTNIRWKGPSEKQEDEQDMMVDMGGADHEEAQGNFVQKFLELECVATQFSSDYILVAELEEKYLEFCEDNRIDHLLRVKIMGSPEIRKFGAEQKEDFILPYVKGLILKQAPSAKAHFFVPGIVRAPQVLVKSKFDKIFGGFKRLFASFMQWMFSETGAIKSSKDAFICMVVIIMFPFCLVIALTWSLIQINTINSNIYAPVFDIYDIFYSSSYVFWLDEIEFREVWLYMVYF